MRKACSVLVAVLFFLAACSTSVPAAPAVTEVVQVVEVSVKVTATSQPAVPTVTPAPTRSLLPTPTIIGVPDAGSFPYRIVAYYPSWGVYARKYSPANIPVQQLTHINYAFGKVDPDTLQCVLFDPQTDSNNLSDFRLMKQAYPHFKVLLSIGGWTLSGSLSDAALTPESREKLVKSCIDLFIGYYPDVIDGFDIDWEYPVGGGVETNIYRPEDKHNMTLLMQEFRRQLDVLGKQNGHTYLLTAAVPASPSLADHFELKELSGILDWMNLMAYDFHGAWSKSTNFNAPLYKAKDDPDGTNNVDAAVKYYLAAGVPPKKLNVGVPFYGRGWGEVPAQNHGLYQSTGNPPIGTYTYGYYDYWDLPTHYVDKNGFVRYWNDEAKVPWLYSPTEKTFITYDDPESIGFKADYIVDNGLGGAMAWDLSGDDGSLLSTLFYRLYARAAWGRP
ncbi:MAG TPA: glycoside hydrolase family 18 protein [Anaerolineae bacterium]|nr:glycoside hydrolase family 18 protein [Anaerolineae bacterium]